MAVSIAIDLEGFSPVVRKFTGSEEMSSCFQYEVVVEFGAEAAADFNPLGKVATVTFASFDSPVTTVTAKVAESVQVNDPTTPADKARFKLLVVPDFWFMGLVERTKIFIDQPLNEIVAEVLDEGRVQHRIADLSGSIYDARPFTCQYRETNRSFVSRLMEDRGIYYYFDHAAQTMVISDTQVDYGTTVPLDVNAEIEPGTWSRVVRTAPSKVRLTGYDFRKPTYEIYGEAEQDECIGSEVHVNDEPVRDSDEAAALAQVRLEQLRMYSDYVTFRSFAPQLSPGLQFSRGGQDYVVTQVSHAYTFEDAGKGAEVNHYRNNVVAIRSDILYRPAVATRIPRTYGTELAHIHSDMLHGVVGGGLAMIDGEGLYTVNLNYVSDRSDPPLAKLRMQQSAAGSEDGVYFPLKKGVEVVIAFTKGNPDLPYIVGAMSHGDMPSHVTAPTNPHQSYIRAMHMLRVKAGAGTHSWVGAKDYKSDRYEYTEGGNPEKEDYRFDELNPDGTSKAEMPVAEEQSGRFHVERRYGDKYTYVDGCDFNWNLKNATFNFGSRYVENHDNQTDANKGAKESFDIASKMGGFVSGWEERTHGFVEKTWGDVTTYHKGRAMTWGAGEGPAQSLQTFNYGPRYTENLVNDDQGTANDKGGNHNANAGKVGEKALTDKTFGDKYTYQQGNSATLVEGDTDYEQKGKRIELHTGDAEYTRQGKLKRTQTGDVEYTLQGKLKSQIVSDIEEKMLAKIDRMVVGKIEEKFVGGRETTEIAKVTHEFKAALTVKMAKLDETTDGTKTETIKGAHMINYSANVIEKGAKMKTQDAKMVTMKGSMLTLKQSMIMIG